jgi:ferredoxin-NADP reductase/uncharacterized protein YcbX
LNTLELIYRYPIKGFPGEQLHKVELHHNEGMSGDRAIAFGTGSYNADDVGTWKPCEAFLRMTIRPELTLFKILSEKNGVRLTSPNNNTCLIGKESNLLPELDSRLGNDIRIHHAHHNRGYWDHKDASISIINLSTIDVISKVINQPIDPLRFRANIYVRADPWSEFSWVGKRLKIGGVDLDVFRPIDRCRAISVNVDTGKLDINMPAVLSRYFGHMFCGVYASVASTGIVKPGDSILGGDTLSNAQMKVAIQQKTAPSLRDWPRLASVIKIKDETSEIKSFWIEDTFAPIGSLTKFKPGQYLRVHNLNDSNTWRSYTISANENDKLRITVKRDDGRGSQSVHQWQKGQKVVITGPFGDASLNARSTAIHLVTAGIGITPTVAKLKALAEERYSNPVVITHVARSYSALALWDDILTLVEKLPAVSVNLYLTTDDNSIEGALMGRPDPLTIAKNAKLANADVHICGPTIFVNDITTALVEMKVSDEKIHIDTFNSPDVDVETRPIFQTGPTKVTFIRSEITDYWNPEDGTLLDFAEARGVVVPSHCRAGLCRMCKCKILDGATIRLVGPEGDDNSHALLCSSIPKTELTLDV